MRKIRQVLQLAANGHSQRKIAQSLSISRDSVSDYLTRAAVAGISWPLPLDWDDAHLEASLFPAEARSEQKAQPDWAYIKTQMALDGATLKVLHEEFLRTHPSGIGYSRFCELYETFKSRLKNYLRQDHKAGEKVFIDYSGSTMPIHDIATGAVSRAQIFIAVLGASLYTYAEAHWTQRSEDWLAAHVRMLEFFGGVPRALVCDNLKSGITRASSTDPWINGSYQNLAYHYGCAVVPARKRQPRDKALAENGVGHVKRTIQFALRNHIFTTLEELNDAIAALLKRLNNKQFQRMKCSRHDLFLCLDKPALQPLPSQPFEYAEFHRVRVGMDGRFTIHDEVYSAPSALCKQQIELRVTLSCVEIMHDGRRVASHERSRDGQPVIDPGHLPSTAQFYATWSREQALDWAADVGEHTKRFLELVFTDALAKEQAYRAELFLKKQADCFGRGRLENACRRANEIGACTLRSIRAILRAGMDLKGAGTPNDATFTHSGVRGAAYYDDISDDAMKGTDPC